MLLPILARRPVPHWLKEQRAGSDAFPITDILRGSVFYPASGTDGRPVQYFAGFAHSFVYVDCNVSSDEVTSQLETFKGFKLYKARSIEIRDLSFWKYRVIRPGRFDGDPRTLHVPPDFVPFVLWAVYDRLPEFGETHGPERFSLLFVGGEGVSTFQSLYYSNHCSPSVIALIMCDGFTGNWTQFLDPNRILARSVMQNPYGTPQYLFCDQGNISPWQWFSKLEYTAVSVPGYDGVTHQKLRLWSRL